MKSDPSAAEGDNLITPKSSNNIDIDSNNGNNHKLTF